MICGECSVVNADADRPEAASLKCRTWTCPDCQRMRQRELKRLGRAGKPTKFITLTISPTVGDGPADRARILVRAWRLIVKRARRHFHWKHLPYLVVIEATKAGEPHLHILARCGYLPQKWLSECMAELAQSPIVWIEACDGSTRVAAYVAKYIGKAPHKFPGCKRYWRSQDWIVDVQQWELDNQRGGPAWRISGLRLDRLADRLVDGGWAVEWIRPDMIRAEWGGRPEDEPKPGEWRKLT